MMLIAASVLTNTVQGKNLTLPTFNYDHMIMPFSLKFQVSAADKKNQKDKFHTFILENESFLIDASICFSIIYVSPYTFNVSA